MSLKCTFFPSNPGDYAPSTPNRHKPYMVTKRIVPDEIPYITEPDKSPPKCQLRLERSYFDVLTITHGQHYSFHPSPRCTGEDALRSLIFISAIDREAVRQVSASGDSPAPAEAARHARWTDILFPWDTVGRPVRTEFHPKKPGRAASLIGVNRPPDRPGNAAGARSFGNRLALPACRCLPIRL